jgi:putative tricarboxylic transport membrane protein
MRSVKICSSLFWLLFSVVMSREAFRLPLGQMRDPGAGFFPLMIGLLMGVLAIIALLQSLKEKKKSPASSEPCAAERFRWWNLVVIVAALVAYALTLTTVGFLINTFLFMLLLLKVIDPQNWRKSLLASLITAVVSELFFNVLLGAQIPTGILGF